MWAWVGNVFLEFWRHCSCCLLTFRLLLSPMPFLSPNPFHYLTSSPSLHPLTLKLLESSWLQVIFFGVPNMFCFVHVIGHVWALLTGNLCSAACMCLAFGISSVRRFVVPLTLSSNFPFFPLFCLSISLSFYCPFWEISSFIFHLFCWFLPWCCIGFNFLGFISSSFMAASPPLIYLCQIYLCLNEIQATDYKELWL